MTSPETSEPLVPDAMLVLSAAAPRWQHRQACREGLTENDVVVLFGLLDDRPSAVRSAPSLISAPVPDETLLASDWARTRHVAIRRVGLVANRRRRWMLATIPWCVERCSLTGRCCVEFMPAWASDTEPERGVLPERLFRRAQWQLATTGLDHVHIATAADGQLAQNYAVFPDLPTIDVLVALAEPVWQRIHRRSSGSTLPLS